jgi:hypothetical protein
LKKYAPFFFAALLVSCGAFRGADALQAAAFHSALPGVRLYGLSREAAAGNLDLSKPGKLDYVFGPVSDHGEGADPSGPLAVPSSSSLEISYSFRGGIDRALKNSNTMILELASASWALPWDASFLGFEEDFSLIRYVVPLEEGLLDGFSVSFSSNHETAKGSGGVKGSGLRLEAVELVPRRFGFEREDGGISLSPFAAKTASGGFLIDPPSQYRAEGGLSLAGENFSLDAGRFRFNAAGAIDIPGAMLDDPFPVLAEGTVRRFVFSADPLPPFPGPVSADPAIILAYPREAWRDARYEIFRWETFPSILFLDTADYGVQDRLLKRLAFFVEKAGFRGRLAPDSEIAGLHGWNAHDYRAEDLARFFDAARKSGFPLLAEERELERILFDAGILRSGGGDIIPGEGALISISRESPAYLRDLFMVHEGFHGLFFIDGAFRDFSRKRWEGLSPDARNFILNFFDYQRYDITDEYLVINEFMAYVLQQPAPQAGRYFGETLASRLAASPRRRLPPGSGPVIARAFSEEADAFSAYVNERWGFAAGRITRVQNVRP